MDFACEWAEQLIDATVGKDEGLVLVPDDTELDAFLRLVDDNGDTKLSKAEFVLFMLHNDDVDNKESGIARREKVANNPLVMKGWGTK